MKTIHNISKTIKLTLILSVLVMMWTLDSNASVYGVLKGKVLDSDGKPAIGASVRVKGTTRGAITKYKDGGNFTIVNILAGNYEMIISIYGNSEFKEKIQIFADSTIDIGTIQIKNKAVPDEVIELNDKRLNNNKFATFRTTTCYSGDYFYDLNSNGKENGIYTVYNQIIIEELKIIKNNISFNLANDVVKFINITVSSNNANMYYLKINYINTFNPPTAKFGILENLSLNAGIVQ